MLTVQKLANLLHLRAFSAFSRTLPRGASNKNTTILLADRPSWVRVCERRGDEGKAEAEGGLHVAARHAVSLRQSNPKFHKFKFRVRLLTKTNLGFAWKNR